MRHSFHTRSLGTGLVAIGLLCAGITSSYAQQSPQEPTTRVFFVFFADGEDHVRQVYEADLREAACHVADPVRILVRGFADRTGAPEYNQRLSERRAVNVASRLARYGVPCERPTEIVGLGEEDAPGQAENRPFSRRVDVVLEGVLPSPDRVAQCLQEVVPEPKPVPQCSKRP